MLSLLFQKSLSRSLEGQRERGENREIQEETRTASPGGQSARLGTRGQVGPGRLLREEERQAGSQPAPLHGGTCSRSQGPHAHRGTHTGAGGRSGAERRRCRRVAGAWHPGELVGERKVVRERGRRERPGEKAGQVQGEWEAERVLVSGWKELKCRSDPAAKRPLASVSPPVRHCCCGCSAIPWCVEAPVLEPHVLPFPPASTERSWADPAPPPTGPGPPSLLCSLPSRQTLGFSLPTGVSPGLGPC